MKRIKSRKQRRKKNLASGFYLANEVWWWDRETTFARYYHFYFLPWAPDPSLSNCRATPLRGQTLWYRHTAVWERPSGLAASGLLTDQTYSGSVFSRQLSREDRLSWISRKTETTNFPANIWQGKKTDCLGNSLDLHVLDAGLRGNIRIEFIIKVD